MKHYSFLNTFDYQNYIFSYLHPDNPYRSMIICYKVGLGKTYASACLAHIYLLEGYSVLYLSHSLNSIENFKSEYLKVVNDLRLKNLMSNIECLTFNKMSRGTYDDIFGLVIVDEVHNLRENAVTYNKFNKILTGLISAKLLFMTATPMVDSIDELDSIIKLTGEENPKISFSFNDIVDHVKVNYIGELINNETLYLSYMKGEQLQNYKRSLKLDKNFIYVDTRQASISSSANFNPDIPIDEQSSKIDAFVKTIKPDRLTVVFCFYVSRGINYLASVLDSIGYSLWTKNDKNRKYAIVNGNHTLEENTNAIVTFNSISNLKGEKIHILIGSSVLSESISLYRVRELHILSPFWNYGQIEQSIGRAVRFGSHNGLLDKEINIYLHAACINNRPEGKDIDMWRIASEKKKKINIRLDSELKNSLIKYEDIYKEQIQIPEIDNKLVFKVDDIVWDLSKCFDTNKFKISWCIIKIDNIVGYDTVKKTKIVGGDPAGLKINKPLNDGYTIWRSCIDDKLRISYINGKNTKFSKRGKIITNVKYNDIVNIAKDLNCSDNLLSIIDKLKSLDRYFDKQIEYDLRQNK